MKKSFKFSFAALLAALLIALTASCGGGARPSGSFGEFSVKTLGGEELTQDIFSGHELTLVNVWATWCGPCVQEMPDLEKIRADFAGRGVAVVSILGDQRNVLGSYSDSVLKAAHDVVTATGATYPVLIPDDGIYKNIVEKLLYYPTTYFVDSEGNTVGLPVEGSRSYEKWSTEIEARLEALN